MFNKKQTILWLAIAASLSACGDSTESALPPATTTPVASSGKAIDGYLSGSNVLCDTNKNGTADAGEATTTTNSTGGFTFAAGCSGTIVVTGGTDATTGFPFKGMLKAPAGSAVATPLTSLLADTGMTAAQLATALGLPAGTDVTTIDPADGKHNDLLRTTLAVQQIVQQLANTLGNLASSTEIASLYSKVGTALAAGLQASGSTPLFNTDGSINQTALNATAKAAVTAAKADPKFASITISDADLFAAASQIATQSMAFLTATDADLSSVTAKFQNPSLPAVETKATVNYLALSGDAVKINGSAITLANLTSGATISTPNTFELDFSVKGTPVIDTVAAVGMELKEVNGQGRVLQMMIDKVNIKNTNGQLSIAPDAAAKVYVYGHTSSGSDINLTLNDLTFKPLSVTNNALTLNYTSLVNKVLASVDNTTKTTAEKFTAITGTFKVTVAVDGLPVRTADGTASLGTTKVSITGSSPARAVTGRGVTGSLTIQ